MTTRTQLLKLLRLWHRRISLFLLIWVFFVALTGIGLNHSEDLGFDSTPLPTAVLASVYGVEPPPIESRYIDGHWISLVADNQLYMDQAAIGYCKGLNGVSSYNSEIYIGCINSVHLVNYQGEVVEQINERFGLPVPISDFGNCGNLPCLIRENRTYVLNPMVFNWQPTTMDFAGTKIESPPIGLKTFLQRENMPRDFHLERLVRDLHSGLFFGLGPWLMDLFAIVLMVLSVSGFCMWWLTRKK